MDHIVSFSLTPFGRDGIQHRRLDFRLFQNVETLFYNIWVPKRISMHPK